MLDRRFVAWAPARRSPHGWPPTGRSECGPACQPCRPCSTPAFRQLGFVDGLTQFADLEEPVDEHAQPSCGGNAPGRDMRDCPASRGISRFLPSRCAPPSNKDGDIDIRPRPRDLFRQAAPSSRARADRRAGFEIDLSTPTRRNTSRDLSFRSLMTLLRSFVRSVVFIGPVRLIRAAVAAAGADYPRLTDHQGNIYASFRPKPRRNARILIGNGPVTRHADGSRALIRCGGTHVLCTRPRLEERVPPFLKNSGLGWVTAEYGMLPRATHTRIAARNGPRASNSGPDAGKSKAPDRAQASRRVDRSALGERADHHDLRP